MEVENKNQNQFIQERNVIPGEKLANVEEFVSLNNETIYEENGNLFSAIYGRLIIDYSKRTVNVIHLKPPKRPKFRKGDLVIARVLIMRKFTIGAVIYKINKKILFDYNPIGNIHVSNVTNYYIDKISEAFKKTDWIRARIIELGEEFELSTDGRMLGVIKADCPTCGTELVKIGKDILNCPFCSRKERRKTAADYGIIEETFIL